ncbi:MAG: flagellar basal body protein FliL [Rhodospirillaceae bacterium]|jgi:flagellar FliL protein|nr:flagellar basal body protein FliL [Rhodospirillaceae bacterium]MBT3884480.1 flagellar basal body protein FliL [Rhodospirillaceae bacterium]MBT4119074.1 flagellar basal body protein FliL [Rhodospirillaceae bacterium]MBT4674788.1 flagellar basal body protein FliL [Rhodospirillaceae bacterium]MBT4719733.1 flagellar basal body protein FliL [Rhodospirillaceae bacterium]
MADDEIDDDDEVDDDDEDGEGEGDGEKSKGGSKKLLIIVGLVVFLVIGAGAAVFFTGLLDPLLGGGEETAEGSDGGEASGGEDGENAEGGGPAVFHDMPEMIVTLNTGGRKQVFLKIRVSLELQGTGDVAKIQSLMPRIIDNFQVYLRELRIDDLKGSAGMYRLREELLTRVRAAAHPAKINGVLFKEMLVQ